MFRKTCVEHFVKILYEISIKIPVRYVLKTLVTCPRSYKQPVRFINGLCD